MEAASVPPSGAEGSAPLSDPHPDIEPEVNEYGIQGETWLDRFVPDCCFGCKHFDGGEVGEYGVIFSRPYCMIGVILPIRKGTCRRQER